MGLKNLFIGQQWRNTHREQTYGHGERGKEDEMYEKSNMETYIIICKIDHQWEFAVWLRKLKQRLCINLEEWDGEGDGREIQKRGDIYIYLWLIHVDFRNLNVQETKVMASSPITSWQIDGERMEIVTDFIFLGSKITAEQFCTEKQPNFNEVNF